jgi:stage II sporulation protein GA (sporulation sigma-E factor processing peptidase)
MDYIILVPTSSSFGLGKIELKVYLDLIILLNLVTDTLLLWTTSYFRRRQVKLWRLFVGSFIGTTYVLALFIDVFTWIYTWPGKLALSIVMLIATFGLHRISVLIKDLLTFYLVGFLFGGGIFAFSYLLQDQEKVLGGFMVAPGYYVQEQATFLTLIVGYLIMFYLSRIHYKSIEVGKRRSNYILPVTIHIAGETIQCQGLIDTGNQLTEPATGIPVIVLQYDQIASLIPSSLLDWIRQGEEAYMNLSILHTLPIEWQNRIRIIPFRGVGERNGLMIALIPDSVEIRDGPSLFRITRVRVGIARNPLTADSSYSAILHPELIHEKNLVLNNEEVHYANTLSH